MRIEFQVFYTKGANLKKIPMLGPKLGVNSVSGEKLHDFENLPLCIRACTLFVIPSASFGHITTLFKFKDNYSIFSSNPILFIFTIHTSTDSKCQSS